jgi:CheY-like chemotaxis protein
MTHRPYRILLVDDDDVTNFLSKELLRFNVPDIITYTTQNGQEALHFLTEQPPNILPDVILLDINMPVMDGWDFLYAFEAFKQQNEDFEKIIVFMFTSSVYHEDINKAKSFSSVKNIYSKPLDETKISEIINLIAL